MTREKHIGVEEFSTTLFEKFLAVVLAAFLFIGCMWAYFDRLDTEARVEEPAFCVERESYERRDDPAAALSDDEDLPEDESGTSERCLSRSEGHAIDRLVQAQQRHNAVTGDVDELIGVRDEARERYRTSLDADAADPTAKAAYQLAERNLSAARANANRTESILANAKADAAPALNQLRTVEKKRNDRASDERDRAEVQTFVYRLVFTLAILLGSFALLQRWRKRHSRWTILGMGGVGAATLLSLVMALDYLNIEDWGLLILSLSGIAVTTVVFLAYQRFLQTRIPLRRARKNQCIFCGYPVGDETHCEGCGRASHAPCSACGERRRVGTLHCGQCGAS